MDWWNVSVFGVIPVSTVVCLFCFKRRHLWFAPIISTILAIAISLIAMPSILSDSAHRAMFFGISIPMHLVIVTILTAIACFVSHTLKPKQK